MVNSFRARDHCFAINRNYYKNCKNLFLKSYKLNQKMVSLNEYKVLRHLIPFLIILCAFNSMICQNETEIPVEGIVTDSSTVRLNGSPAVDNSWTGIPAEEPVVQELDDKQESEGMEGKAGIGLESVLSQETESGSHDSDVADDADQSEAESAKSPNDVVWGKEIKFEEYKYGTLVTIILIVFNIAAVGVLSLIYSYPIKQIISK